MTDAFQVVFRSYTHRTRGYHNIEHVTNMIAGAYKYGDPQKVLDKDGFLVRPLYEAILFHDVYYEVVPRNKFSNEEMSATIYSVFADMERRPIEEHQQVMRLIRATEHHFDGTEYDDYLTNLLLDLDLLSFTAEHDDFKEIQESIDSEYYGLYPDEYIVSRRLEFLTDIYENKKLRYRVIDPTGALTKIAYFNLSMYLDI